MNAHYAAAGFRASRHEMLAAPAHAVFLAGSGSHGQVHVRNSKHGREDGEIGHEVTMNQAMDGIADSAFSTLASSGDPLASLVAMIQMVQNTHISMVTEHLAPSEAAIQARSERLHRIFQDSVRLDPASAFRAPTPLSAPQRSDETASSEKKGARRGRRYQA